MEKSLGWILRSTECMLTMHWGSAGSMKLKGPLAYVVSEASLRPTVKMYNIFFRFSLVVRLLVCT